jgi:thiamine-phosphate pyrophosphorylase
MKGGLYAIVDVPCAHGLDVADVAAALVDGGAGMVQLRAKGASTAQRRAYAETMVPICRAANVPLWINDDPRACVDGVHGVHLGQDDRGAHDIGAVRADRGFELAVGLSTHDLRQLRSALQQSPDYVAFGPVLATTSKQNPDPTVGFEGLVDACRMSARPVVAIGGLDASSGARAIEVGARWVAVIGALRASTPGEIRDRARSLVVAFERAAEPMGLDEVSAAIPVLPPEQLAELARWSDSLGVHVELGLPARFRPWVDGRAVLYRPCDVADLQFALGKSPDETWEQWRARADSGEIPSGLVQLRVK